MLDLKFLRENLELVKTAVAQRQAQVDLAGFEALDAKRRQVLPELEGLRARRNEVSQEVGRIKRQGGDPSGVYAEMKQVGGRIKELEGELAGVEQDMKSVLMTIPNPPHPSVPVGKGEEDNPVAETWGELPEFDFEPLNHWDIGEALGIIDFEAAARMTGARFVVLKGPGPGWSGR